MYGYFVSCNYEGTAYAGSQRQANTPCTIEALVQEALNKAFRYRVKLVFLRVQMLVFMHWQMYLGLFYLRKIWGKS